MKHLYIYPFASLTETTLSSFLNMDSSQTFHSQLRELLVNIFLATELVCIYVFFIRLFKSSIIKKVLYATMFAYLAVSIFLILIQGSFIISASYMFVPQAILILIPGFLYLFGLLNYPAQCELKNEPAFWIVTGLILYFGGTLPLFLLNMQFNFSNLLDRTVYTINFYCYGILFLLFIKAYLCKKKEIRS